MANKTMKVGYRLVRNGTSTADRAPYLGVAVPIGSLAYDNILQRMLDRGTFMTRATAQYFLNAFYEFAAEKIAEYVRETETYYPTLLKIIKGCPEYNNAAWLLSYQIRSLLELAKRVR